MLGESLFAETLVRTLAGNAAVEVVGSAATPEAALTLLITRRPDAVIVAGAGEASLALAELELQLLDPVNVDNPLAG